MKNDSTPHPEALRLVELLRPYNSIITYNVEIPGEPDADTDAIYWLKTRSNHDVDPKVFAGLEILVLLLQLDWELWKREVERMWRIGWTSKPRWWADKPHRVGIEVGLSSHLKRLDAIAETFAMPTQQHALPAAVFEARSIARELLLRRAQEPIEVPIRLVMPTFSGFLGKVLQFVATDKYLRGRLQDGRVREGLHIRYLRLSMASRTTDAKDLLLLAEFPDGINIESLGLVKPEEYRDHPESCIQALWKLLAVGLVDAVDKERSVKHLMLTRAFCASHLPKVYSTLAASNSVETAVIDPRIDNKTTKKYAQQVWEWIAYSIFSEACDGRKQLQGVSISVSNLQPADVDRMRGVVDAKDPLGKLCSRSVSLAGETITASKVHLDEPKKQKKDAIASILEGSTTFKNLPVLKRSKPWITVFLSAWGSAWVHEDDVVAVQRGASGRFTVRSIAHIKLVNMTATSLSACIDFLRLFGRGLRHLTLQCDQLLVLDDWCVQLFDTCPELETLVVEDFTVNVLDNLLDAYESGKCRLTRVILGAATSREGLARLFTALGDNSHPVARYLGELYIGPVPISLLETPVVAASLLSFLERNEQLYALEVRFRDNQHTIEESVKPFLRYDRRKLLRPRAPLDVRQRLAFLSAVSPGDQVMSNHREAMVNLDSSVLSIIFTMATTCCERRVRLYGRTGIPSASFPGDGKWYV